MLCIFEISSLIFFISSSFEIVEILMLLDCFLKPPLIAPLVSIPEFQGTISFAGLTFSAVIIPLLVGGIGMAIGLATVGRKVIKVLATEVVTLSPSSALAASISIAMIMLVGTYFGFPLSGTHVRVSALIGGGWVSQEQVKKKQGKDILISWVITVPIAAVMGIAVYMVTFLIF